MTVLLRADYTSLADNATLPIGQHRTQYSATGAAADIANGALRVTGGSATNYTGHIRLEHRAGQRADNFTVFFRVKNVSANVGANWYPRILFRSGNDTSHGDPDSRIGLYWTSTAYGLDTKLSGSSASLPGGGTISTLSAGSVLLGRIRVQGDIIRARMWREGDTEPLNWPVTAMETTVPRRGKIQILIAGGTQASPVLEFSHFVIEDISPLPADTLPLDSLPLQVSTSRTLPLDAANQVVYFTPTTDPVTGTLPLAASAEGKKYTLINKSDQIITLAASGSDTISGTSTASLTSKWDFLKLASIGTDWLVTAMPSPRTPGAVAAAPTAVPFASSVNLSWLVPASTGVGSGPTDYSVQYRTTSGPGSWTDFTHSAYVSGNPNMTVTGLTNGTSYDFQVAARNPSGLGTYSPAATATPAAVVFSDAFRRTDSASSLGTSDAGSKAWTSHLGTHGISAYRAYTSSVTWANNIASVDAGVADGTVYLRVDNPQDSNAITGLVFRYVDQNNFWYLDHFGALTRVVSGAATVVSASAGSRNPLDVLSVVLSGTAITAKRNASTLYSGTSATHQTATRFGLMFQGPNAATRMSAISMI